MRFLAILVALSMFSCSRCGEAPGSEKCLSTEAVQIQPNHPECEALNNVTYHIWFECRGDADQFLFQRHVVFLEPAADGGFDVVYCSKEGVP